MVLGDGWSTTVSSLTAASLEKSHILIGKAELIAQSPEISLSAQDNDGDNELMLAVVKQEELYASIIIDTFVKRKRTDLLNLQNREGNTALLLAVKMRSRSLVEQLVLGGADLLMRDYKGNTALHCASEIGILDLVKLLTPEKSIKQTILQSQDNDSAHPYRLYMLDDSDTDSEQSQSRLTQSQLLNKKNAELYNYCGWNSFHLAVQNGHLHIADYLALTVKVDMNAPGGTRGMTALHIVIQKKNIPVFLYLTRKLKVDVNMLTYDGLSPIQFACGYRQDDLVPLLLLSGAYISDHKNYREYMEQVDTIYDSD